MKKLTGILSILFLSLINNVHVEAQINPQWYCMSHDEIIWDIAFDNANNTAWIATRGGLVKFDRATGNKTYYNAANSPLYQNESGPLKLKLTVPYGSDRIMVILQNMMVTTGHITGH